MANDKLLVTQLFPLVSNGLKNKESQDKLIRAVSRYMDKNSDALTTPGPSKRPTFMEEDREVIYEATGIAKSEVAKVLKENPAIKQQWVILNEPFNATMVLATRYAAITKNEKLEYSILTYLTLSMYPYLYMKYFKFEPNPQVMAYTISNMSNKYKIKTSGTILRAMIETSEKCYELHKANIIAGTDKGLVNYITDIRTRINSLMKNVAKAFYDIHKQGLYMNSDGDSFEETKYHESDSDIYAVDRITNNVTLKLMVNGPDSHTVNMAAKMCGVSVNELRNYTNGIVASDKRDDVRQLVEAILTTYIVDEHSRPEEVSHNNKFLVHANNLYKKSNTSDTNVIKIKNILDEWIEDLDVYKKTQRAATINNFRRALYLFVVISIMKLS